jgi:hypothetical protein
MKLLRRDALVAALFGGGMLGLRSIATGLPVSLLANPRKVLADMQGQTCTGTAAKAQYIILNTLSTGDPIGCDAPGTYDDPTTGINLSGVAHPGAAAFPMMAPTSMSINGRNYTAAQAWSWLGAGDGSSTYANVLSRTAFCHIMTNTPVHPKEPQVLELMGATASEEMFPSVLAKSLAPCLGTLQSQPVSIGAANPSEALLFQGQPQPTIPPSALKATLLNPTGPLTDLQPLRDDTLQKMHDYYAQRTLSTAQKQYIDSMILSQQQVRGIAQTTLSMLDSIKGNSPTDQITAALALILMKVSPVIAVRFPFGGDNHSDPTLKNEATQTVSSVQSIVSLMQQLKSNGLSDSVTFITLNVFGRTMGAAGTGGTSTNGRNHNENHQMSLIIGKGFKGSVVGGVGPVSNDYGCLSINSSTGLGQATGGDIAPVDTLASWAQTVMAGVGIDQPTITSEIASGKVITAALA